jgi:hypothetical protein
MGTVAKNEAQYEMSANSTAPHHSSPSPPNVESTWSVAVESAGLAYCWMIVRLCSFSVCAGDKRTSLIVIRMEAMA